MVTSGLSEHPMVEGAIDVIENVYTVDSKDRPEIQVCDLLLGAVMSAWNQKGESEAKADLRRYIAEHLGWDELRKTTFAAEKKFNVWYLTDKFKTEAERTQRADVVRLKYPLPASRRTRR